MEISEKARSILAMKPELVDQELYQVLSIIIDDEGQDWSDYSGVGDLETYVLGSPSKLGGRYNKYLVENFLKWSVATLPRTATALFSVLDSDNQDAFDEYFVLKLANKFAAGAESEADLKSAARMLRSLSRHLVSKKDAKISNMHEACEVFSAVVHKLNMAHPYTIEMNDRVRRSVKRDIPELDAYTSRFPKFLAMESRLVRAFIRKEGEGIRVDASLMSRINDRFDAMVAGAGTKIPLGANMEAVFDNANTLLCSANEASDAYRYESHVRQPEKAVAMVLATLEAPAKLLRLAYLSVGSDGDMSRPFKKASGNFSEMHTNLLRLGCTPEQLKPGYTNLFATAVTVFGNANYQKWVSVDLKHEFLNKLYPYADFDEVQKKASPGGRSIFADYIRAHHPERTQDLTLQQKGRVFIQELGV
ncbi:hypothetical protein [Pseudomonas sp. PLMAX]|uniref:hypothetical protein n=1 Tax=Pseudomonas sp. PLMAX TaxID=2201998 RepID=UPI0038BDA76E